MVRLPKWLENIFCKHLHEKVSEAIERGNEQMALAFYWKQVAMGMEPMPGVNANIQRLANNLWYIEHMKRMAQFQAASIESRFVIKDAVIPEDGAEENNQEQFPPRP